MDIKIESGRRLRTARKQLGMKLREVCAQLPGVSVSKLSNWEQGRNMIGLEHAKVLAPLLKVKPSYLYTLEDTNFDNADNPQPMAHKPDMKNYEPDKTVMSGLASAGFMLQGHVPEIGVEAFCIYTILCAFWAGGNPYPGVTVLAEKTGVTEAVIEAALAKLEAIGLIRATAFAA